MLRIPVGACLTQRQFIPFCAVLVLALAIVVPRSASAQVPYIRVYTDPAITDINLHCGAAGTTADLFVVLHNVDFIVSAVDFHIDYPPSMTFLTDMPPDSHYTGTEQVTIGSSPSGIAIAWANCCMPDGSQGPIVVERALILWNGNCQCQTLNVGGYGPLGKSSPSVVRGSDFQEFAVQGSVSTFATCVVAVEPTTWGRVKSLYR